MTTNKQENAFSAIERETMFLQAIALELLRDAGALVRHMGVEIPHQSVIVARNAALEWVRGETSPIFSAFTFANAVHLASGGQARTGAIRRAFEQWANGTRRDVLKHRASKGDTVTPSPITSNDSAAWWRTIYRRDGIVTTFARSANEASAWIGSGIAADWKR